MGLSMGNLWWLDRGPTVHWSREEQRARMAIFGSCIPIFFIVYGMEMWVLNSFILNHHINAVIGLFTACPGSVYLARRTSERLWPKLIRQADEQAAKRLGLGARRER